MNLNIQEYIDNNLSLQNTINDCYAKIDKNLKKIEEYEMLNTIEYCGNYINTKYDIISDYFISDIVSIIFDYLLFIVKPNELYHIKDKY